MTTVTLPALLAGQESAAVMIRYGDVTVEVTGESVIFRDPDKEPDDDMMTSFDHSNFRDIITMFELATGNND